MQHIDIVFIKPGNQTMLYGELSAFQFTGIEPPFWGALLAGYLRQAGYSVVLWDAEVENWSYEDTAAKIADLNPLVAAVVVSGINPSASTMNMTGAGRIVSLVRQQNTSIKTLLFGLHPSVLPERTLKEEEVDFVCQGEGFYTLPKLLNALKNTAITDNIEGLWFQREEGTIVSTPRPPLVSDLDEIPMPAWDLLPMAKYRAHNWHCFGDIHHRQPYAVLYTSLGCPFNCSFCCINALFGKNTIRYRGLESVLAELDFLVNTYGIRNIKIIDEMFGLDEKRIITLCDMIIEREYDLNMWAYARVDTVSENMLSKMKQAGIHWLAYGFESGSDRVIKDVGKGYTIENVARTVQLTRDAGINICGNFMFGLPEDDYRSMNETLKLMLDMNAEWANIYSTMAYPGSKLYNVAIKKNWPLPDCWKNYSQYARESLPLPTNSLTGGQVLAFRDYAFNTYYNNPRYLNMIRQKFGDDTVQHIRQMTSRVLERTYAQPY